MFKWTYVQVQSLHTQKLKILITVLFVIYYTCWQTKLCNKYSFYVTKSCVSEIFWLSDLNYTCNKTLIFWVISCRIYLFYHLLSLLSKKATNLISLFVSGNKNRYIYCLNKYIVLILFYILPEFSATNEKLFTFSIHLWQYGCV